MNDAVPVSVIIVAAGLSRRMGGAKKEFMTLPGGGTVLSRAAEPFVGAVAIQHMVVAVPEADAAFYAAEAEKALFASETNRAQLQHKISFIAGGDTRQKSVHNALEFLAGQGARGVVLIHDGARPFVTGGIVRAVAEKARDSGAACPVIPPVDTLKEVAPDCSLNARPSLLASAAQARAGIPADTVVVRHLDRTSLAAVQTPQGFLFAPLLEAHRKATRDARTYTDDTEIWSAYVKSSIYTVRGSPDNSKITYPKDVESIPSIGESLRSASHSALKIGLGYDLHRLVTGSPLVLGGVVIPFAKGEAGHSDGDALLHAVADALLGAAALGDVGSYFPDGDAAWKGADSRDLLRAVLRDIQKARWSIGNIDCVAALEQPKLLPYRNAIRESVADTLEIDVARVFVKAKTGEGIGEVGRGEAVAAWVTCLLSSRNAR